jgi:hypothetical protein
MRNDDERCNYDGALHIYGHDIRPKDERSPTRTDHAAGNPADRAQPLLPCSRHLSFAQQLHI